MLSFRAGYIVKPLTYTKELVTFSVYDVSGTVVLVGPINLGDPVRLGILLETQNLQGKIFFVFVTMKQLSIKNNFDEDFES